jgi:hypothetical protein
MNTLHEVVYQIVSSPTLLAEIAQNGQVLFERFNLATAEAQALLNIIQDSETLANLLATDYIPDSLSSMQWDPKQQP